MSGCSATSRRARTRAPRRGRRAAARGDEFAKGWYVEPTLFTDVDNSMTIAQEEIFGPVLVVIPFEDEDDAVRIANDSVYGLAGGVCSGSLERSMAVARPHPRRRRRRQRWQALRAGRALRRLQAQRRRPPERQLRGFEQYLETKSIAWPVDESGAAGWPSPTDRTSTTTRTTSTSPSLSDGETVPMHMA